jgi:hypothetical protein
LCAGFDHSGETATDHRGMLTMLSFHPHRGAAVVALLAVAACSPADDRDAGPDPVAIAAFLVPDGAAPAVGEADLDAVRAATERFRDVQVALAEGYIPDPTGMCVTAEMEGMPPEAGAMGIHYLRPDLLQITAVEPRVDGLGTHTDFSQPSVLIYEPQADGSLELVAIENLVFRQAWYDAGNAQPPSYYGIEWDRMVDDPATDIDEAHGFASHYDRHVWLYRENPTGTFAPFNPNVTCAHAPAPAHDH